MATATIDVLESTIRQLEDEVPADVRYQVYQKRVLVDKHKAELLGTAAALRPQDPTSPTFQLDLQLYQAAVGSVKDQVANFEASLWAANPQLYEAHLKLQQLQAFKDQLDLLQNPDASPNSGSKGRSSTVTPSLGSIRSGAQALPQRPSVPVLQRAAQQGTSYGTPTSSIDTYQSGAFSNMPQPSSPASVDQPLPFTSYPGGMPSPASPHSSLHSSPPATPATSIPMHSNAHAATVSHISALLAQSHANGSLGSITGQMGQMGVRPGLPPTHIPTSNGPPSMTHIQQHVVSLLTNPAAPRLMPRPPSRLPSVAGSLPSMSAHQIAAQLNALIPGSAPMPHVSGHSGIMPVQQATDPLTALSAAAAGAAAAIAGNMAIPPNASAGQVHIPHSMPLGLPPLAQSLHLSHAASPPPVGNVPRVPNPGVQKPPPAHVLLKELQTGGFSFTTNHGTVVLDADDVELAKQLAGCEISDESYDARPLQLLVPKDGRQAGEGNGISKLYAQEDGDAMRIELPDGRVLRVSKDAYNLYQQLNSGTLVELARLVASNTTTPNPKAANGSAAGGQAAAAAAAAAIAASSPMRSSPLPPSSKGLSSPLTPGGAGGGGGEREALGKSLGSSPLPPGLPSVDVASEILASALKAGGPPTSSPPNGGPAPKSTEEWVAASRNLLADRTKSADEAMSNGGLPQRQGSTAESDGAGSLRSAGSEDDDGREWRLFQKLVTTEGVTVCEVSGAWPNQKFRWRTVKDMPATEKSKKSGGSWFKRTRSHDSRSSDGGKSDK